MLSPRCCGLEKASLPLREGAPGLHLRGLAAATRCPKRVAKAFRHLEHEGGWAAPLVFAVLPLRRRGPGPRRRLFRRASPEDASASKRIAPGSLIEVDALGEHSSTIIYLHGFTRDSSRDYLKKNSCLPWMPGGDRCPGLRAVLPTAYSLRQPWGPSTTAWYSYASFHSNDVGDPATLEATRTRLEQLVRQEVGHLGSGKRVFLGGLSQGCTMALDTYLRLAVELDLGGFVGSVGFLPHDNSGFPGSSAALEAVLLHATQAKRPLWLQCATDDSREVPWDHLVEPSLHALEGRCRGLQVRYVSGRGHNIGDWETHMLNDFIREFAGGAE